MELDVLRITGESTGKKVKLSKEIFGVEPNDHAIYLDVGTFHSSKKIHFVKYIKNEGIFKSPPNRSGGIKPNRIHLF